MTVRALEASPGLARCNDFFELTKPRITAMVLVTTAVGFYLAEHGPLQLVPLFNTLLGTGLVSAGSCVLNMVAERAADARMRRTLHRPLPAGRLGLRESLAFGVVLAVVGLVLLWATVNPITAGLGLAALISYNGMYTPLKVRTPWCTWVGAVSGAIPPLMGWAAARNEIDGMAWVLFGIMFLWQIPHFLAIAWLYREDYARGGFPMLTVHDVDGRQTVRQMALYAAALWGVSLLPTIYHAAGLWYWLSALILGAAFLVLNLQFRSRRTLPMARRVFLFSIIYLPVLFGIMMVDKVG
ncbi:MAG TPA: heme o synthase [Candidatus Xenobia bacterium]|jgi:protoheme IX farnesyltransferase